MHVYLHTRRGKGSTVEGNARLGCCRGCGSGEGVGGGNVVVCLGSVRKKRSPKQWRRMHRVNGFTPRSDMRLAGSLKTEGNTSPPVEAKTSGEVRG